MSAATSTSVQLAVARSRKEQERTLELVADLRSALRQGAELQRALEVKLHAGSPADQNGNEYAAWASEVRKITDARDANATERFRAQRVLEEYLRHGEGPR